MRRADCYNTSMKNILALSLVLTASGCKKAADARSGNTAPARYVNDLQHDMNKASEAQQKANQAIAETSQAVNEAAKE